MQTSDLSLPYLPIIEFPLERIKSSRFGGLSEGEINALFSYLEELFPDKAGDGDDIVYGSNIVWDINGTLHLASVPMNEISFENDSVYVGKCGKNNIPSKNGWDSHVFNRPSVERKPSQYVFMPFKKSVSELCGLNIWKHKLTSFRNCGPTLFIIIYATCCRGDFIARRPINFLSIIKNYVQQHQPHQRGREITPHDINLQDYLGNHSSVVQNSTMLRVAGLTSNGSQWVFNTSQSYTMALWMKQQIDNLKDPSCSNASWQIEEFSQFCKEQEQWLQYLEKSLRQADNRYNRTTTDVSRILMYDTNRTFYAIIKVQKLEGDKWEDTSPLFAYLMTAPQFEAQNDYEGELLKVTPSTCIKLVIETKEIEGCELFAAIVYVPPGFKSNDVDDAYNDYDYYGEPLSLKFGLAEREFEISPTADDHPCGSFVIKIYTPLVPGPLALVFLPIFCKQ